MTAAALTMFVVSGVLIWGGGIASLAFYLCKPEVDYYPEGGEGEDRVSI